jgi:predicted nucleic acid-binding protein
MAEKFYLDTSIWLDIYEKRGENSKEALALLEHLIKEEKVILFSDLVLKELKSLGYTQSQVNEILSFAQSLIQRIHMTRTQIEKAKDIAIKRNIPKGDALHAILARDNEAQLISRDQDFKKLRDITLVKTPNEATI